jgi:uncharacterized protein (TIGR02466 family)
MIAPELNDRLILTYGTLLYRERLDQMLPHNDDLARIALSLRADDPGVDKSNQGGWHSSGNIFGRLDQAIAALAGRIQAAIRYVCSASEPAGNHATELTASLFGWFNVNENGDYSLPHHHSGHTWSGVYYIRTGPDVQDRPMSGRLEFLDPRVRCDVGPKQGFSHTGTMAITPRDGLLLVFPSYLEHFVHPYHGGGQRITLAFNSLVRSASAAI